jgi:MFS transporter, AAHS family, 4-hydroxybenzoate transporter
MSEAINVADFIDERKPGAFQRRILFLCMAVLFMDGYDTQVIGYLGPSLAAAMKVPPAELRPVFLIALVGLMIGGLVCGPLADRFGRKTFVVLSTLTFGVLSFATAWAWSVESLIVLRFLTGLGLGGAMPNTVALGVEYFPKSRKGFITSSVWVGFSIGAAVAGFVAAALVKAAGWQSVFMIGGIVPILLAGVLAWQLPESLRFLVLRDGARDRIATLLGKIAPESPIALDARFISSEERSSGQPVSELFRSGRAPGTSVLWMISFLALAVTFLMTSWLPIAFNQGGLPQDQSILALTMYQVGAVAGALIIGRLMDKYDRFHILMGAFLISGCCVLTLSYVSASVPVWALLALMLFNGVFLSAGGTPGVNALTGTYYPTHMRSTGIGWTLGSGRIGSLFGIWLGGALIAAKFSVQAIFLYVTCSAFVCAILVAVLRAVTPRQAGSPSNVAVAPQAAE